MAKDISGSVVNKISFDIDKKSWANLDKFQKRISDVKKQLSGLSGNIRVSAVVSQFDKVQKAVGAKTKANTQKEHNQQVIAQQKHVAKLNKINKANSSKAFGSFVQQQFGGSSGNKASNTAFADMLKRENREIAQAHAEALRMNKKYDTARNDAMNRQRRVTNAENMMAFRLNRGGASSSAKAIGMSELSRYSEQYMKGAMTATEFSRAVNQSTSSLIAQSQAAVKSRVSTNSLRRELIQATAAYSAFSVGANIFQTGKDFDSMKASMQLFAGNESGVMETMSFLRSESERLGINFKEAAQNFTKFAIVSRNKMSKTQTRELFSGFSEYATVLQVDQNRFSRGMMAIQQMMSKGKISS